MVVLCIDVCNSPKTGKKGFVWLWFSPPHPSIPPPFLGGVCMGGCCVKLDYKDKSAHSFWWKFKLGRYHNVISPDLWHLTPSLLLCILPSLQHCYRFRVSLQIRTPDGVLSRTDMYTNPKQQQQSSNPIDWSLSSIPFLKKNPQILIIST